MFRIENIQQTILQAYREGLLRSSSLESDKASVQYVGLYKEDAVRFQFIKRYGQLHGVGRVWYKNGQLNRQYEFQNGILSGWVREYFPDGRMSEEINFVNNAAHGRRRRWYADGRLRQEYGYDMNRLEGPLTEWHPNGHIKGQGEYCGGKQHGILKEFDTRGRLLTRQLYVKDVLYRGRLQKMLDKNTLSVDVVRRIENTAVRRIFFNELGVASFARECAGDVLDTEEGYELIKINWHREEEPLLLVKVKCPSTNVYYTLRVPPSMTSAREAVAWTFGLPAKQYNPVEEV